MSVFGLHFELPLGAVTSKGKGWGRAMTEPDSRDGTAIQVPASRVPQVAAVFRGRDSDSRGSVPASIEFPGLSSRSSYAAILRPLTPIPTTRPVVLGHEVRGETVELSDHHHASPPVGPVLGVKVAGGS